jgi:hypothetical protein
MVFNPGASAAPEASIFAFGYGGTKGTWKVKNVVNP